MCCPGLEHWNTSHQAWWQAFLSTDPSSGRSNLIISALHTISTIINYLINDVCLLSSNIEWNGLHYVDHDNSSKLESLRPRSQDSNLLFPPLLLFFLLPASLTLETLIHAQNFLKSVPSITIMVSKYLIKKILIKYLFRYLNNNRFVIATCSN